MQANIQNTKLTPTNLSRLSGPRRAFLKSAGALALAAPAVLASPGGARLESSRWWHSGRHFELLAEGVVPMAPVSYVLPPPPMPPLPPDTPPLEARQRLTFPVAGSKNVLSAQVFMVPEGLPVLPLPQAPPLEPQTPTDPVTVSYFEVEIEYIQFGTSPLLGTNDRLPSFAMSGRAISNPVRSPFGELTGMPIVVFGSFLITDAETGEADFIFLGGAGAGNHATASPTGKGILRLPR